MMTMLLEAVSWSWREARLMSFQASSMVFVVLENSEANDDEDADEMDDEKPMWRFLVLLKLLSSSAAADGTMNVRRDGLEAWSCPIIHTTQRPYPFLF
jgi:hypothetical protein